MDKNIISQYDAINNKIHRLEQELKEAQESRRELINRYNLNKPREWPSNDRINNIGQNGNDGLVYVREINHKECDSLVKNPTGYGGSLKIEQSNDSDFGQSVYEAHKLTAIAMSKARRDFIKANNDTSNTE